MPPETLVAQWKEKLARAEREPLPAHVPALIDAVAGHRADQVLLDFFETNEQVRYGELADWSRRLAGQLWAMGMRPGMCAAIMLPNGPQWHVTWLALLRLGMRVLPVNPSYTARELEYVLSDAQAQAWFIPADRTEVISSFAQWPAHLRRDWIVEVGEGAGTASRWRELLEAEPVLLPAELRDGLSLDSVANIQYTSGTTGFPKGCILTHGYWLNLGQAACLMHVAPMKRFFTAQPFFYMDPFWQVLMTVMREGTLTVARKISGSRILGWLADREIEWAQLPEIALKSADSVQGRTLALKQVFTFGWSGESRVRFAQQFGAVASESFGMTEIGLGLAMPPGWPATQKSTSVGIPHIRRQARIVGDDGREVGPDTPGELQIRGAHMFSGYFNKPEANADAFEGGWFRTGDAFVRDADGFYRIVGRFKDMIRRSGENIAAREVEAVVRALPEVLDCAAVAVADPVRGEEVKIMIQLHPHLLTGGRTAADILPVDRVIAHCQSELAPFKVPRYIQFVAKFPRTSSNKIAKHLITGPAVNGRAGAYDKNELAWCPAEASQ